EHLEGAPQDHRRRDAVDVVVAVDGDALLPPDRFLDPDDRAIHVGEPEWIVELVERRVQESMRVLGIREAPEAEQARDGRMGRERGGERGRLTVVARQVLPDERFHRDDGPPGGSSAGRSMSMNACPSAPMCRNLRYRASSNTSAGTDWSSASAW